MKLFASFSRLGLAVLMSLAVRAYALPDQVPAADPAVEVLPQVVQTISDRLKKSRPNMTFESVKASPIPGLYIVNIANGPTLYSTADGAYFVVGDLFQSTDTGFVNLAEKRRQEERVARLSKLSRDDMIIFSPSEQPPKASITVFTDVDCYYCQKLHREVADLNRVGIEVRYLAYPRAGIGSDSYKKIASAWCSKDRQGALTRLKNRENLPLNVCPGNPVAKEYNLGNAIGVRGTPALVTESGELMAGYMPVLQLAHALGVAVDPDVARELAEKQAAQRH